MLAYVYAAMIEEGGSLLVLNLPHEGTSPVLLRRNEAVHFAKPAQLQEMKTVEVGYVGGSQGGQSQDCKRRVLPHR